MLKSIKDFDVKNKRILVRCYFNEPIDDGGNLLDDFRIKKTLPTIQYLVTKKAKIILMSQLDEPIGRTVKNLSLDKIKERLKELLNYPVEKTGDCIGKEVEKRVASLQPGEILMLENLNFHKKEEDEINEDFAKKLAKFGDIYINEAFSESHRDYASITGVAKTLPHGAGLLFEQEIENLNKVLENPARPLVVLVGGAKVKTKAAFIEKISKLADFVLIGGLIKKELLKEKSYSEVLKNPRIIGPENNFDAPDIDDKTIEIFRDKILKAKTVVWNGPFGKFEEGQYKKGTLSIAKAIIESGAFSVVGGGETVEFLKKENLIDKFGWVSTGGGAMLAYLAGEKLPGIEALK